MMPKKNPGFRVRIPIQILGAASSVGRGTFLVPFRKARTDICTVLSTWSCVQGPIYLILVSIPKGVFTQQTPFSKTHVDLMGLQNTVSPSGPEGTDVG